MSAELFSVSGIVFVHQEKAIGAKVTLQQHLQHELYWNKADSKALKGD